MSISSFTVFVGGDGSLTAYAFTLTGELVEVQLDEGLKTALLQKFENIGGE